MVNGLRKSVCNFIEYGENGIVCSLDRAGAPICTDHLQNSDGWKLSGCYPQEVFVMLYSNPVFLNLCETADR
jgi:hypothetical protein